MKMLKKKGSNRDRKDWNQSCVKKKDRKCKKRRMND